MAKNNAFINNQKRLSQQVESVVPAVYAAVAMSLDEFGIGVPDMNIIFARSQEIWANNPGSVSDLLIECYNQTGVMLMTEKQYDKALKEGLIEP